MQMEANALTIKKGLFKPYSREEIKHFSYSQPPCGKELPH